MQLKPKIHRSYSYVIFVPYKSMQGPQKVGKTNIITRFTKDQFTQLHNLTLEGQQTAILDLDGRLFQVNLYDTAGQQNMMSLKAVWRNNKDGFIFIFAINSQQSFQTVINQIRQIKHRSLFNNVAIILVGNKADLLSQRQVQIKTVQSQVKALGIKYFQISAKTSSKDTINTLISELIDINEMNRFHVSAAKQSKWNWSPCQRQNCKIF